MDALHRYATAGHRRVQGWLNPLAIQMIRAAAAAQGRTGPVCEIGVHHGKLFLLLHLLDPAQKAIAVDLYEDQTQNVDGSGSGSSAMLDMNLTRHGGRRDSVEKIFANSMALGAAQIIQKAGGPIRVFSVDGGHTAAITANDLALAEASVMDGGIVILDDYFNESWPGVSEGACRYFMQPRELVPFAIGGNKVLLVKGQEHAARLQAPLEHIPAHSALHKEMFGHSVRAIGEVPWLTRVRRRIPLPAKRVYRRLRGAFA
jgi:hypothetical protein